MLHYEKIYPPGFYWIFILAGASGMATIKVIDVLGLTVFTQRVLQTKGNNYKQVLLPKLINGNYFLLMQINTQKIFIQH